MSIEEKRTKNAEHMRKLRRANPEGERIRKRRYNSTHKEQNAETRRNYNTTHPEAKRAERERHRARKRNAFGIDYTTNAMITARIEYYGWCCWICGKPMEAIDHVKPLSKGGAHLPCNLRPICRDCNSSKGNKWPLPGFLQHFGKEQP